jgi:small-conductance mechanosensitive channel
MSGNMPLVPFDMAGDVSQFLANFGLIIILIIAMFVGMLYGLAYFSRYIEYRKLKGGRYLDAKILDMINKVVHIVVIFTVIMLALFAIQTKSQLVRGALFTFFEFFPAIFVVIVVLFIVYVLVRVLGRFMTSLRRQVAKGAATTEEPRFFSLTEIFLKYTIYTIGIVFAVFGGLAVLPSGGIQQWVWDYIFKPLTDQWQSFVFVALAVVIAYVLYMLADSVLEDIKKRSKKFSPRVIDVFRSISRYVFIFGTIIVIALILLGMVVSETETYVISIGFIVIVTAVLVVLAAPIRNVLSGIVLMMADPFDEGDRVKILDNLVCDVLQMNLTLTTVKSLKGEIINIPNSEIMSKSVVNFTRSGTYAMTVEVKVSYKVPHEQVEQILVNAADKTNGIANEPKPEVFGKDVDKNTIIHQLLAYIENPEDMKAVKSELVYNIQELFHEKDITVLFSE